jgi:hypothetical protein
MAFKEEYGDHDGIGLAEPIRRSGPGGTNCRPFAPRPTKLSLIREEGMEFGTGARFPLLPVA